MLRLPNSGLGINNLRHIWGLWRNKLNTLKISKNSFLGIYGLTWPATIDHYRHCNWNVCLLWTLFGMKVFLKRAFDHSAIQLPLLTTSMLSPNKWVQKPTPYLRGSVGSDDQKQPSFLEFVVHHHVNAAKVLIGRWPQCDQMASLLAQYFAICNTEHLPKTM